MWRPDPVRLTQAKLLAVPLLTLLGLSGPTDLLAPLGLAWLLLLWHTPKGPRQLRRTLLFMLPNWLLISAVYAIKFGSAGLTEAALVSVRILLGILPGLWFYLSTPGQTLIRALDPWLSRRNATVLQAALALLPTMVNETRLLFRLARLRGAHLSARDFLRPRGYAELGQTVLLPLLVQMMRFTEQQALALRSRGYQEDRPMTRFEEIL
ncbi:energy-coupling factor transporter transmembrane component T [Ferrimonas balearica]|uniref:energy-coupling factor transporter transmembrane component T n=1 Tax=Ferrimonas balearica TaxID=44012 RepID=UPI001C99A749|nr:energy-coupling factor transporter transmembrane component T [Ferrimonas balearica]MBY5921329.1 energy-coupling factor transporter transmembrane protein EcfT [Ferrimonas balearica]MBY5995986.1 energy-coupling factor transporter transmembrane protein EcfT [Ferrimonas balearica]